MDNDAIVYLFPYAGCEGKEHAREAIEANPRHTPPRLQRAEHPYCRLKRESTEPPENPDASALDYLPCLAVRFSDVPRTDRGFTFGSNPRCDLVLNVKGISNAHFCLTFDDVNRPIIKDLHSLVGTEVTYNGGGRGTRRKFQWIVGGHPIPRESDSIIITVPHAVSFQIVVPSRDITSPVYINRVNTFKQGTETAENLLADVALSNPPTRPGTGANTPGIAEIHLTKKLGEGSFGVVTRLWNVSTGQERVVKSPALKAVRKGRVDEEAWRREARIMKQISHPHIVQLIASSFGPQPQLHLEYVPCGSLEDHEGISYTETVAILSQCLSALAYLHELETPIAHRDIKPANILVQYRVDVGICVKLGDFGLSRDRAELMTLCGTQMYIAPEIYSQVQRCADDEARPGYTTAVDIWSLGVVACELTCGLPRYEDRYWHSGTIWCERILARVHESLQKRPSDLGRFLLSAMVVLNPVKRLPAGDCYNLAMSLPDAETASVQSGQTTPRDTQNHMAQDLSTVVYRPNPQGAAASSLTRPGAPPPATMSPSPVTARQYQVHGEPTLSAKGRRSNWPEGHEVDHFLEDYSADPFNSLYVGSSLASQLGGNSSEQWASQSSYGSLQWKQVRAGGSRADRGSAPSTSGIPQGESGGLHAASVPPTAGGGNAIGAEDYDEIAQAALMLQAIRENP